jgi:hypothetical protein
MERGAGSAAFPVAMAFVLNSFALGWLLELTMQVNDDRLPIWPFWACLTAGTAVTLLVFFNRFKCIEAFTSRDFDPSTVTRLRIFHATLNALFYAWRRGLMKLAGR